MTMNLLALLRKEGKQVLEIRILTLALLLISTASGCAPEAKTSDTSSISSAVTNPSPTSSLAAGAAKATTTSDMDWLQHKAGETKGDFSLLSAEDKSRVQAITKGHGTEVLKGMAPSK